MRDITQAMENMERGVEKLSEMLSSDRSTVPEAATYDLPPVVVPKIR
jgi:hypothetical protein